MQDLFSYLQTQYPWLINFGMSGIVGMVLWDLVKGVIWLKRNRSQNSNKVVQKIKSGKNSTITQVGGNYKA